MDLKKELGGVADAVTKIMMDEKALHPNQQKLDVHEPEKDELTADDFKKLRAGKKAPEVKKEEVEQIEELKKSTLGSYVKKASKNLADRSFDHGEDEHRQYGMGDDAERDAEVERNEKKIATRQQGINRAATKLSKEEVEELDELSKDILKSYLKGSKRENDPRIHGDSAGPANQMSSKARSLGRTEQDKEDSRYEGSKLAKRKLGVSGTIPAKVMAKEEVEELDELSKSTLGSYVNKASDSAAKNAAGSVGMANTSLRAKNPRVKAAAEKYSNEDEATKQKRLSGIGKAVKKLTKEAVEQIDEYKSTGGVYKHKGTYGTEKSLEAGYTDFDKENELAKKNLKDKKPKKYGARQNFVRSTRVNESFTSILASYKENGLKGISEMFATEQASQEEYEKEIEKAKAKSQGKDKAEVAKASVQAVKSEQTHTKIEVIDMTDPYNIQKREIDLEERMMTDDEMEKKEDIVKGMKKGMKGFKERYGERAKEVMYATAAKIAKDKA